MPVLGAGFGQRVLWLFDLDNTLHDARLAVFPFIDQAMAVYIADSLSLSLADADVLRYRYWQAYGATLKGLVRHHGVNGEDFLAQTHLLPGLESRLVFSRVQLASITALPGRKWVYTNGPRRYAKRVLGAMGCGHLFDGIWAIEDSLSGRSKYRPKPDRAVLRHLLSGIGVNPHQCVLVDDSVQNLRCAKRLGLKTVWMCAYYRSEERRWLRRQLSGIDAAVDRLDMLRHLLV